MGVRAATHDDIPTMQSIEVDAGRRFRDVGMDDIADHEPMGAAGMAAYVEDGRAWLAEDGSGYVLVEVVDGNTHVEQLSVRCDAQGRGVGRALLDHVADRARAAGHVAITLTTFRDVPFNGPLYRHLGFEVLDDDEIGPELAHKVIEEIAYGLDPALRVCMRRLLRRGDAAVDGDDGTGEVRPGA